MDIFQIKRTYLVVGVRKWWKTVKKKKMEQLLRSIPPSSSQFLWAEQLDSWWRALGKSGSSIISQTQFLIQVITYLEPKILTLQILWGVAFRILFWNIFDMWNHLISRNLKKKHFLSTYVSGKGFQLPNQPLIQYPWVLADQKICLKHQVHRIVGQKTFKNFYWE